MPLLQVVVFLQDTCEISAYYIANQRKDGLTVEQKIMKWYPLSFRGQNVKVIADRIEAWNREQGLSYYELQSTNEDWARPRTLCSSVRLNFWGMMACPTPLVELDGVSHITPTGSGVKIGEACRITLADSEVKAIMVAMAGRPCTVQKDTRDMDANSRHRARML